VAEEVVAEWVTFSTCLVWGAADKEVAQNRLKKENQSEKKSKSH